MEDGWQPLVLLLFAAAVFQAPRIRTLRVHPISSGVVGGTIHALAACALVWQWMTVLGREPKVTELSTWIPLTAIALSAGAFVISGVSLGLLFRGPGRVLPPLVSALLAVSALAPLNC